MTPDPAGLSARALDWHISGQGAVLATVVETWGSAPRPCGSELAIRGDGHMEGSVSGGCVEGAVILEALEALEDGAARVLTYGVSDEDAFTVGLACGGQIRILVDPVGTALPVDLLADLVKARRARQPVAYVADLDGPTRALGGVADYAARFRLDRSGVEEDERRFDGRRLVAIHNPPLRMIIVGGVHIAQQLLGMAQSCGYDTVLVDPRPAFASPERFGDIQISHDWPDDALRQLALDQRCAVVTLTHDPKLDDPAIETALNSDAFYIGCLGSTRTHAKRLERLRAAGFDADQLARLHGPVGLNIGGRAPAEIAVSIMAEVTQTLRRPKDPLGG